MPPSPLSRVPAPLLALAAAVSLQFGAAFARLFFDQVGATGATVLRLGFATVILLAVVRPRIRRWDAAAWRAAVLLGLALGGMNTMIYLAFSSIPLGVAVTIEFLGPLAVALAQTRRWIDALWALLAFAGIALLGVGGGTDLPPAGVACAALAGAFWAGYILASANLGRALPGTAGLPVSLGVALLLVAPLGWNGAGAAFGDAGTLAAFVLVAVLSSALPYAFELEALRRLPTRVFGVLSSLGPALAAVAGLVVLNQSLRWQEVAALVLVSVASAGVTLVRPGTRRRRGGEAPAGDAAVPSRQ